MSRNTFTLINMLSVNNPSYALNMRVCFIE
jgi:hypothetical protein